MRSDKGSKNKYCLVSSNEGFSIVELLVAVAILAAVFTPILQSFLTAANINSKSQKLQNATSLAETIMEDVKGNSIADLHEEAVNGTSNSIMEFLSSGQTSESSDFVNTPPYTINYTNISATQGRKYDASVTISTSEYSETSDISGINDANIKELPKINGLKTDEHAVLSWELNQYDGSAMVGLVDENTNDGDEALRTAKLTTIRPTAEKNTYISIDYDKDVNGDKTKLLKITCTVEYKSGVSTDKPLQYLVYTGYFEDKSGDKSGGPNIYLFYTASENFSSLSATGDYFRTENIIVKDNTTTRFTKDPVTSNIEEELKKPRHNVYLILQDSMERLSTASGNSNISITVSGDAYENTATIIPTSIIDSSIFRLSKGLDATENTQDDVYLYTNLKYNDAVAHEDKAGELFAKESKDRIYYVTVNVFDNGDSVATLTSTMKTGSEADKQ